MNRQLLLDRLEEAGYLQAGAPERRGDLALGKTAEIRLDAELADRGASLMP
jgi:hypothetical protein